jgi:hypothetical protein
VSHPPTVGAGPLHNGEVPSSTPRVLIRTFSPTTNANYGGILQAWALQRTLGELGVDAIVDSTVSPRFGRRAPLRTRLRGAIVRLVPAALLPRRLHAEKLRPRINAPLLGFAARRIPTRALLDARMQPRPAVVAEFDAFVVGSDQVWRPKFMNLPANLFGFLPDGDPRRRFSYAASFGTDRLDLGPDESAVTRRLAQRLDGVSVRESSGVDLARDTWGVAAEQHVDPTLLVDRETYRTLASSEPSAVPPGSLIDYVLDETAASRSIVDQSAARWGSSPQSLLPKPPRAWGDYRAEPQRYRKPSIEQWLHAFDTAGFVVTDSYHGTVFSIINNVPFIAIVNHLRGAARFESLLDLVDLRERIVEPGSTIPEGLMTDTIDWAPVNARIDAERMRSRDYLTRMLSPGRAT